MSLKIRLARAGTKKRPVYHIVIADSRSPRDGRFIERLGYFNPLLPKEKTERLKLDMDKVKAWMAKGALPTDRVARFLDEAGVMKREKRNNPTRAIPRKQRRRWTRGPRKPRRQRADTGRIGGRGRAHLRRTDRRRPRHTRRGEALVVHGRPAGGPGLRPARKRGWKRALRDRIAAAGEEPPGGASRRRERPYRRREACQRAALRAAR